MLPILGALVLQAAYGAVDVLVVGWFGTTEGLSGVSTGSSIVNDLQDKPEGLDVSVLPTGSVAGLQVALHPYG